MLRVTAAAWYDAASIHCPLQYLAGKEQIFRNSARERDELRALRLKAKPKTHRDGSRSLYFYGPQNLVIQIIHHVPISTGP